MDKSLERSKQEKLTPEETDNPQSPLSIKEIEFVVKNLPTKKTPGPNDFSSESYQSFKRNNTSLLWVELCFS